MDLSSLTPEERAALKAELDAPPPEDPVKMIASLMDMLIERMQDLDERICRIDTFIQKDLIGGIKELSDSQASAARLSGLKGKYGSLFEPHASYLKDRLGDPEKIYDLLDQHLAELRGVDGYTDETGDSSIKSIAEEIGRRVSEITGKPVVVEEAASAETPAAEAVEAAPEAEESDPMAKLKEFISKMKERDGRAA